MTNSHKLATGKIILGILFLAVGLTGYTYVLNLEERGSASLSWSATSGKVIETRHRGGTRNQQSFHRNVKYTYNVSGKVYVGTRVRYGSVDDWAASTEQDVVGKSVNVYYDEQHPDIGVLEPGFQGEVGLLKWFSVTFVLLGVLACAHSIVVFVKLDQ